MDVGESPLDVLSRVAEIQQAITISEDSNKHASTKQLPTTKWKRDRRTRPEYSRKSDPKIPDEFSNEMDAPLDMSVRQRGQPPSYSQTINNPEFRSSYRTSVITQTQRDDIPSGISMCDPIIDEHFRRSLGKDYVKIFSNNNIQPKDTPTIIKTPAKMNDRVMELMDSTGLSVDDHFAKALGDTWLKLNKKDEIECDSSEKEAVISV